MTENGWADIDQWVDDDFDANQLLGTAANGNDEDDWDDYDSNEEEKDAEKELIRFKGQGKKANLFDKRGKIIPKSSSSSSSLSKEEELNWRDRPRSRQTEPLRDRHDRLDNKYKNERHEKHGKYDKPEKHFNNHEKHHNNHDKTDSIEKVKFHKKSQSNDGIESMSKAFSRLMPIDGWKPGDDNIEDYASDVEDESKDNDIMRNVNPERLRLIQKEDDHHNTYLHGKNNKGNGRPKSKEYQYHNSSSSNNNKNQERETHVIRRIHYSEEKNIPKAPASMVKKQTGNKNKESLIESKWADEPSIKITESNNHKDIENSREYYRNKKLSNKLDWDNGIKGSIDEYDNDDEEDYSEDEKKIVNKNHIKHEHFTYDNSSKESKLKDISRPFTAPELSTNKESTSKPKPKARPSTTIDSMWA